ncbi:Aldo/keto reductase [Periconia macrospinosa]|uniref:Aldo/keto reductase n=1 Tax=Periconia macrospinosa TaxID=97972 RepID=A0A2V1DVJ9_9PLEO|nr:Aldo/keto reductase [Periconia macrospinosa]
MAPQQPVKIILGTHQIGDATLFPGIIHFTTKEQVTALLTAFKDRGYIDLDTARNYPGSESLLAAANAPLHFNIHTKILSGMPGAPLVPAWHSRDAIAASISASLKNLCVDSVETMFLHVPDRDTPLTETLRAINEAYAKGQFKKFGISNYMAKEVEEMLDICEREGLVKPSVFEGHYNAACRSGEEELFPLLRKHGVSFWAYSPAAGGFFSDQRQDSPRWDDKTVVGQLYQKLYGSEAVQASVSAVRAAASAHGISPHAAALRWTIFHSTLDGSYGDGVTFGMSKIEQLHQTLDAIDAGPLPDDVAEKISGICATFEGTGPAYHL